MPRTDVRVQVRIARPRAEVADLMFDPAHESKWAAAVVESRTADRGRMRCGSRVQRLVSFLGKRFCYEYRVTAASENDFVEMEVDVPFPMKIRYELVDTTGGTFATVHARGDADGFFRFAGPLLNRMVRRSIRNDLQTLKELLESRNLR